MEYNMRLKSNSNPLFQMANVSSKKEMEKVEDRADSPDQSEIPSTSYANIDEETLTYIRSPGKEDIPTPDVSNEEEPSRINDLSPPTEATSANKKKVKKSAEQRIADELTEDLDILRKKYNQLVRDHEDVSNKRDYADKEYHKLWYWYNKKKDNLETQGKEIDKLKIDHKVEIAILKEEIKGLNEMITGIDKDREDFKKNLREAQKDHSKYMIDKE